MILKKILLAGGVCLYTLFICHESEIKGPHMILKLNPISQGSNISLFNYISIIPVTVTVNRWVPTFYNPVAIVMVDNKTF